MWPYSWVIGCQKWPFCIFYGILLKIAMFSPILLINKGLFFDQTKWYSTQKERLFQMAYFKFHEKNYWESSKLTDSKINPSRENHAHFISSKLPHKNHPREYIGTTLWFIKITTSVVKKSQILSVAFHLSTTVCISVMCHSVKMWKNALGLKWQRESSGLSCITPLFFKQQFGFKC